MRDADKHGDAAVKPNSCSHQYRDNHRHRDVYCDAHDDAGRLSVQRANAYGTCDEHARLNCHFHATGGRPEGNCITGYPARGKTAGQTFTFVAREATAELPGLAASRSG